MSSFLTLVIIELPRIPKLQSISYSQVTFYHQLKTCRAKQSENFLKNVDNVCVFWSAKLNKGVFEGQKSKLQEKSSCHNFYCLLMDEIMLQTMHSKRKVLWMEGSQQNGLVYAVQSNAMQSRVLLLKTQDSFKLKHFV